MPGTLYVVATPIGNLEDITLRALRVLRESDLIAAEDTRVTRKLLSHFDIHTPLTSYHQHTKEDRSEGIIQKLLEGASISLVTDAGTPGISDPGLNLIARAIRESIQVVPLPGASAVLAAIVASGLPSGKFTFDGFPPRTKTDRNQFFSGLAKERRTIVLYEAPSRLIATLQELQSHLGDRQVAIAREVTKRFEEVFRGNFADAIERFRATPPRGEFTLVIHGAPEEVRDIAADRDEMSASLIAALAEGLSGRDAVQRVSKALNLPRKQVYAALLQLTNDACG